MKRRIIIGVLIAIIFVFGFFLLGRDQVTVYLGVANADLDELPLQVSIDDNVIYTGTIANNPYKYEVLETSLGAGIHSLSVRTRDGYEENTNFFVLLDQHLVIEYYSPCGQGSAQCFEVRNRLRKFRLE